MIKSLKKYLGFKEIVRETKISNDTHARTDPFFDCLLKIGFTPEHIVDVGANTGNWTRTALKYFPDSYYSLFEPQEKMGKAMHDILQNPKVKFHCMGAGPVNGQMKFTERERDDSFTFSMNEQQAASLGYIQKDAPVVMLDEYLKKTGLPNPNILKIDAEGWDLEVLKGAEKTASNADVILMEAAVMHKIFKNKVQKVILELESKGFTLFDITDLNRTSLSNALWLVELAFVKKDGFLDKAINKYE